MEQVRSNPIYSTNRTKSKRVKGLVSLPLVPYVKSILGVDISQGVVDKYNKRAIGQGFDPTKMSAVRFELKGVEGELDNKKFDVIVVSYLD